MTIRTRSKILIVEDDVVTVETIKLGLNFYDRSLSITAVDKGEEAIRFLENEYFDALLLDLGLPDIDGLDVLKHLRSFSQVPVLVVSARYNPEIISRTMKWAQRIYPQTL
jgi:DNA-binding response OmpR family regulator